VDETGKTLTFHYIKAPAYQEVHFHGAFGGIVPSGDRISLALFSERAPIPQESVHPLKEDGTLGEEIDELRVSKEDVVRTVNAVVYMDLTQAVVIRNWLDEKIKVLQQMAGKGYV
jgi:hypothetical protein